MRKFIACLAAFLLVIPLSGCSLVQQFLQVPDADKYLDAYQNNPQYLTLTDQQKKCYGSIYTALTDGMATDETVFIGETSETETVTYSYPGIQVRLPSPMQSKEEIDLLYNAFFRDNPQFFYVRHVYGMMGYAVQDQVWYDTLVLTYTGDAAHRLEATQQLEEAVTAVLAEKPDTNDQYVTELYLHDRLTAGCTYDQSAAEAGYESVPLAYTAYGALVEGTAVCEGYAKAMQLLLERCGIDSVLVTGQSIENGEQHMWNLVTINGEPYHLDPTWNDTDDQLRHTFFNVTDQRLSQTHVVENQPSNVLCTATTDNYYIRTNTYVDTYERQQIAHIIAERINAGDTRIELLFSPDTFDNGLLFLKNVGMTQKLVQPYLKGETTALWTYTLSGDSDLHILFITKN